MGLLLPLLWAALALHIHQGFVAAAPSPSPAGSRALKRSHAKRWDTLHDIVTHELHVNAKRFLQERGQTMSMPVEIDVLLLGFDADGAFGYQMAPHELDELLSNSLDRELCPTVWETGRQTAVCFQLNWVVLTPANLPHDMVMHDIESVLSQHMVRVGDRYVDDDMPGQFGSKIPIYEVDAQQVEDTFLSILAQVYDAEGLVGPGEGSGRGAEEHRSALLVLNPNKLRMDPEQKLAAGHPDAHADQSHHWDVAGEWRQGLITSSRLIEQEGAYMYRYNYRGKGAAAAWVSSHNFAVIDLSAGPVQYGPLTTTSGSVSPSTLPRILPMMLRLTQELEAPVGTITLQEHMAEEAAWGQMKVMAGQLAAAVHAAARHLIVPDVALHRLEYAERVAVQLVVLQDHLEFNLLDGLPDLAGPGVETHIDLAAVQSSLHRMLGIQQMPVIMPSSSVLHQHKEVLSAISRATQSWSSAVLRADSHLGMHHRQRQVLDSTTLMEELRRVLPSYTSWHEQLYLDARPASHLLSSARHNGTRMLPVFVLSLRAAPAGLLFDNGQLVAATHDMVVVLQLLDGTAAGRPTSQAKAPKQAAKGVGPIMEEELEEEEDSHRYSGHVLDGKPLPLDGASGVTGRIIGGLSMALAGVVPPSERVEHSSGGSQRLQDWRWSVGCLPWGPYANSSELSGLVLTAARRNVLVAHLEAALTVMQARLDELDSVVEEVFQGPWPELMDASLRALKRPAGPGARRHWLDTLASRSPAYNASLSPSVLSALEAGVTAVEDQLEKVGWSLTTQAWADVEAALPALLQAVDSFSLMMGADIQRTMDVAACCRVRHDTPSVMTVVVIVLLCLIFVAIISLTLSICSHRRVARVSKRSGAPVAAARSSSGMHHPATGKAQKEWSLLPRLGSGKTTQLLPR